MNNKLLLVLLLLVVTTLSYAETMKPEGLPTPVELNTEISENSLNRNTFRNGAPDFAFVEDPMSLAITYYDYFPGSYDSVPIRIQPSPVGFHDGGGIYITYQATPEQGGVRRVNYVYLDQGSITSQGLLNSDAPATLPEGFSNFDIDQDSGDPLFSWHHLVSATDPDLLECSFAFDQYSAIGFPGLLSSAYSVMRNPYTVGEEEGGIFIWPTVHVGPSPVEDKKRVYVIARNHTSNINDYAVENSMLAFADFEDVTDIATYDEDDWTYVTIPQLDQWRIQNIRSFKSNVVSRDTGVIAIAGHKVRIGEDVVDPFHEENELFVLENTNFGEGDWQLYTAPHDLTVNNPIDPETGKGYFPPQEGAEPYKDMRYIPYVNRHNVVVDDNGNYHFVALHVLLTDGNTWYPNFSTTKHIKFDRTSQEFTTTDIYPQSEDGSMYLPWSDPPEYNEEHGYLETSISYPVYWWGADDLFHENYHRMVANGPYMVALFQESMKARLYNEFNDENYEDWANKPETYIHVSNDYGKTWSEPIIMNSFANDPDNNYVQELDGMVPTYWYLADSIEMLENGWGRIQMMFLDQNNYGSSIQGNSLPTGGTIMYTSMDINFGEADVFIADDDTQLPSVTMLKGNYPNPFNPNTTISYTLSEEADVNLNVYNVKGQLIKTLVDGRVSAGNRYVVWNGTDNHGQDVSSGVYFYKLSTENHSEMRKMLLVK